MYSTTKSALLMGIDTLPVTVEVDLSTGMPVFDMVGYLASEVREAKERVKTAISNSGIVMPPKHITVNLYPADIRKSGTGFDLPIAIALLHALGIIPKLPDNTLMIGELSLSGALLPVKGVLPVVADGVENGNTMFIIPKENLAEAGLVTNAKTFGFSTLKEVIAFLQEENFESAMSVPTLQTKSKEKSLDFSEVHGQKFLKRAAEVAASGMHNLLMVGPPGAGKTMISSRIPSILPSLTEKEQLELSKIYSICGLLSEKDGLLTERPFRNPHYSITSAGLLGGGASPKPGEISLAHKGVLFLDELTEFQKQTLEILRQPMEEHEVRIVRNNSSVTYPSDFLLLAAMNPCNCGYYPDMQKCRCSHTTLRRYHDKISQPLLDRIDLCVEAKTITFSELMDKGEEENSKTIRERVERCHEIQKKRYANETFDFNSKIPSAKLELYCSLGHKEQKYMEQIFAKEQLTARTYHKILRVARTIADMDGVEEIQMPHLMEAVCYRTMEKDAWMGGLEK